MRERGGVEGASHAIKGHVCFGEASTVQEHRGCDPRVVDKQFRQVALPYCSGAAMQKAG